MRFLHSSLILFSTIFFLWGCASTPGSPEAVAEDVFQMLVNVVTAHAQIQTQHVFELFGCPRKLGQILVSNGAIQAIYDVFPRHLYAPAISVHGSATLLLAYLLFQQVPVALLHVVDDHGSPAWQHCGCLNPANLVSHDKICGVSPHFVIAKSHGHTTFLGILLHHGWATILAHWEAARFADYVLWMLSTAVFYVFRTT